MTTAKLLRQAVEEGRVAVAASLPKSRHQNREALVGMCAVVSCEVVRRLDLAGRRALIEYRVSLCPPVYHFWTSCDGYIVDGTSMQLGGPLLYLCRNREPRFFHYAAERSWRTPEAVARFLRKLGWSGPAAALLVEREAA